MISRLKFKSIIALLLCITLTLGAVPQVANAMPGSNIAQEMKEFIFDNVKCKYTEVSSWGSSVNAEIVIENKSDEPIYNWSIDFDYNGTIDNIWNADIKENSDGYYMIKSKDYNAVIRPNSSVSFGLIAHGETEKPSIPENINIYDENGLLFSDDSSEENTTEKDETSSENQSTEDVVSPEPEEDIWISFPERLKALNYTILTTDNSAFNINANTLKVKGDVHTNSGFGYSGNSIEVVGNLEAVNKIKLNTSSDKDSKKVSALVENAAEVEMPIILEEVYNYAKEIGDYSQDFVSYNADDIAIAKPIVTDSGASINGTTFLDKGILYAKDSISYNINSFATPSGSRVLIVSENGDININGTDININAVLYAPNGTVNINVNSLNLNGRIIAKNICMNGTLLNINAGPYDYDMVKFLYKPELEIATAGNLKENRKIDLDVVETTSTKFLNNCTAEWKITKLDCEDSSATYAVDETASTATHRELLFREAGTYTVEVTVKSKKDEYTAINEIVIDKDVEPEAAFDISDKYFLRDEKGEVNLSLIDKSVSIDNDELVSRKWYVYYDADNNGEFEESEKKLFSDANKEAPNLTVNNVGKYKVRLEVAEGFTDTIESLIDDSVFKKGYAEDTFEVGNKKPTATVSLEKAKKADLVFTVGECSEEQLAIYNQKAEELRGVLEAQGVDARIETVSTKLLTAQDAFDWKEFTHTDYGYNHIKYTENGISMIGNYDYPVRDFLYVSSDNSGKKTFSFDLQRDRTDWHSMEGGGFLFNSTVDEANNTIKGFCVLAANGQLKLIKIDCNNLSGFRQAAYGMTQHAGQLLTSVPFNNVYDVHHLEVVVESNTVSVWDGDTLKIDSFVLPENDYGYGFGPITCHIGHCCSQLSYFTFNNIKMETMDGASLSDIVNGYDWRTDAERYVFNLSNKAVPELMTEEEIADTAAALLKTDTKFIGIGNENNENQYRKLINAIDGEGIYHSCEDLNSDMNDIEDIIVRAVNAKDYSIKDMITKDITVEYKSIFTDEDGDELLEQEWEYEYDPSIFDKVSDGERKFIRSGNEPVKQFEETGAYTIRLKVRDNPFAKKNDTEEVSTDTDAKEDTVQPDNQDSAGNDDNAESNEEDNKQNAFEEYCLWSDTAESDRLLIVQERPKAEIKAEVTTSSTDDTKCTVNVTYNSYDEDHMNDKTKGIRQEMFAYKNINDSEWTEGRFPNEITIGDTYLIKYQVKDAEGTLSFPAVYVVKTNECRSYKEIVDENPPSVVIIPEKYEIGVGEEIKIEGYADDDYGIEEYEMFIDDEKVLDHMGRCTYVGKKEGTVIVKANATDIGGNKATGEIEIRVTDKADKNPPTAMITSPSPESDINFGVVEIIGTAKDDKEFWEYTLSYKEESESEYHEFAKGTKAVDNDKLGEIDITKLKEGNYIILLTAKDKAGNKAYYAIGLYLQSGNDSTEYELTCELTDMALDKEKGQISIKGTAKADGNFGSYTLSLKAENGEERIIAEGTEEKDNELLAVISTSSLYSGTYHLTLKASNDQGDEVETTGSFMYKKGSEGGDISVDKNPPSAMITSAALTENNSYINISGSVTDDKNVKEWSLKYASASEENEENYVEIASGTDAVADSVLGVINTSDIETGDYRLKLSAYDDYGNGCICTATLKYVQGEGVAVSDNKENNDIPDVPVKREKELAVNISKNKAKLGETIHISVTLPDGADETELEIYSGDKLIEKGKKATSYKTEKLGDGIITAKLGDKNANVTFFVYDDKDTKPPVVSFDTPDSDEAITKPVDIVGSAYDEEGLHSYKLEYRLEGTSDEDYILISEGDKDVKNEKLGNFDTTMLSNGRYELKLTAKDKGGNTASVIRTVIVEGKLKVGTMNIGFTDITNKLSGITVNVNRMYSSMNKDIDGDFGYGWNLGLYGLKIFKAGDIESGFEMQQSGSIFNTKYQMVETEKHDLIINYGDGTSDRFALTFNPERSSLVPIMETEIGYRCVTNPKLKLEIVGDSTAYVTGDSLIFYDEDMYESVNYKLTTEDENEIYINDRTGVYKIVSKDGNVIIVDKNGYHSQDGKSITLERDSKNRITKATDIHGKATTYTYDKSGNLASVITDDGKCVSYTYDNEHNLVSITDPNGVAVARNEYDENGRLIATIDADGNRIEFEHGLDDNTEIVRDRRGNATAYTYDDNGNVVCTTDPYGNKTLSTFDEYGNQLSITDANGNTTNYSYDSSGNISQITDASGQTMYSNYTTKNELSDIKYMDKTMFTANYDTHGNMTECVDANGNKKEYEYDTEGKLTGLSDAIGTYQTVEYDESGNVSSVTNGAGDKTTYTYDDEGRVSSVSAYNKETGDVFTSKNVYDESGNMLESIDSQGNVTKYEYDADGNNTAIIDSKDRRFTYEYDEYGNVTKTTYPDGTSEEFAYDANGNNITAKNRNGLVVSMKYDKLNRLSEKVYPDNTKEFYEYDACGNLTKNTAVNGATTTYEYNSINKNISNTDAYGNVTKFTYDDMGRHVSTIDPLGNQISFEYDGNGNITKTTFADGSYVTSTYDARDRVTEQVDANGNKTSYIYDGADRLIEVVDALGGKTTYDYDQNGSLIRVTDALGHVTSYTYDSLGRVTCTENALGNKATNKYDETGKLVEATTYSGIKTIYTYDELDRVVEELIGDDSIKYTYDADGKITKVAKNGKEATFSYNEYGQLTSKTDENNITISYTYNEYGQIVKSNNGFSDTSYEYDLLGRVTRVIDKNGKVTVYEYDANGNKTAVKYPNGTVMSYTYDACNRLKEEALTNASGKQLAKYVYSHGKSGEKTKVEETDEQGNKITTTYAYDKLNRLVKETIEGADGSLTNTYEYDSVSNRTKKTTTKTGDISKLADTKSNSDQLETGETTYVYNAVNQLMVENAPNGTIEYIYDADGNLVKQTGLKNAVYTYDAYGKLATAEIKKADKTTKESYTYDYNGNRISKTTDGKTVNYVVDESYTYTKVVAEYNSQGEVTADYTIGDDIISATIDGKVCYYVYDGHGDVRYLVDEKGTFTDKYSYDAYGVLLRKVGDTNNEFLYCGEQYNESTGLYYLRARYMNPGTGTFISMDSYAGNISDPVSLHKYLYANANPVMYIDPSGNNALSSAIVEIGAAMISASYEVSYVAYCCLAH